MKCCHLHILAFIFHTATDKFQINEINVDLRISGLITRFSVLTHALYDKSASRSIVYPRIGLWLDTESLGFNAEVRGLGQFEIRLYLKVLDCKITKNKIIQIL